MDNGTPAMKILALERETPGSTPEQFQPYLQEEARQVWGYYQDSIIREMYFRQDRHDAVLVLECAGLEQAKTFLDRLPLVAAGLITFDLIPLVPYSGFARLFTAEDR
jgi:hypothetical protein